MTDLKKPQEDWTRLIGLELASTFLAAYSELTELEQRYSGERTQVLVLGDASVVGPQGIRLRGVRLGHNTDAEGSLWAWIPSPQLVELFKDPQRQDLVASGPPGALVSANASGISGSWDLPATAGVVKQLQLLIVPDWLARADAVWDGGAAKDRDARRAFVDAALEVSDRLREAQGAVLDGLRVWAELRGAAFLGQPIEGLAGEVVQRDPSGAVHRRQEGFVSDLGASMRAESVAGPQGVSPRVISVLPATFAATNRGRGRVPPFVPGEACPATLWTFRCIRGAESGFGGQEEFEGRAQIGDRELSLGPVRVGQPFMGPRGFGPLTLERDPLKKGDPQDALLASATSTVVSGARSANTDAGSLHWQLTKETGGWTVSLFSGRGRGLGDLVGQATGLLPGAGFQATERNVSGLFVAWRLGAQPREGASGLLDLGFFRADGEPDRFSIRTEVQGAGRIQALLSAALGAALPSLPVPTIPDGLARAGLPSAFLIGGTP